MEKYTDFVLCQRYNFLSRLYTFDIGKKLIIKFANKDTEIQDILVYWFRYFTDKNINFINNYNDIYEYYDLEKTLKG